MGLEDYEAALADVTACIEHEFQLADSYKLRGDIYHTLGDEEKARADWEASLEY